MEREPEGGRRGAIRCCRKVSGEISDALFKVTNAVEMGLNKTWVFVATFFLLKVMSNE